MKHRVIGLSACTLIAVVGSLLATGWRPAGASHSHSRGRGIFYEVTITNLTRGQVFSPAVVATHRSRMEPLFVPGAPASPELAAVAEDAITGPLVDALSASRDVASVAVLASEIGPILPGKSASLVIEAKPGFRHISLAGMLVQTNDAFYALNGVRAPNAGSKSFRSPAYDAGSEANNELCEFIPGPPCENAEVRTETSEGYVHIHAGIHGIGDLAASDYDWRNPTAMVTVRRVSAP